MNLAEYDLVNRNRAIVASCHHERCKNGVVKGGVYKNAWHIGDTWTLCSHESCTSYAQRRVCNTIGMQQPPPVKSLYVSAMRDASTLLEGHMFV